MSTKMSFKDNEAIQEAKANSFVKWIYGEWNSTGNLGDCRWFRQTRNKLIISIDYRWFRQTRNKVNNFHLFTPKGSVWGLDLGETNVGEAPTNLHNFSYFVLILKNQNPTKESWINKT